MGKSHTISVYFIFILLPFPFLAIRSFKFKNVRVLYDTAAILRGYNTMFFCAEQCACLEVCKSFNHYRTDRVCLLFDTVWTEADWIYSKQYIYMEKRQIPWVSDQHLQFNMKKLFTE